MGNTEEPAIHALGQIAIPVEDLERATAFYRDTLGLSYLFDVPGRMSFFDLDGLRIMLAVPEEGEPSGNGSILYFRVKDLEAVHERLSGQGVGFLRGPHRVAEMEDHDLWMAFFSDGEVSTLALMSEKPKAR